MQNPYQPMPMYIARAVIETDDQSLKTFELLFRWDEDRERFFSAYRPGQFCQLSIFGKGEASFGVASAAWEGNFVRFTINKIGAFTHAVHAMNPGDSIGMRGPLGNHYPLERWKGSNVVIIGGGYAFTTLYALTKHLLNPAVRSQYGDLTVIYGAREPGLFLYKSDIKIWYDRDDIAFVAFVCGPPVMIRFTLPVLNELGFSPEQIYTSLEKRMKCGIGKCGRCNIGPKYICTDGPVFSFAELRGLPADL